MNGTGDSTNKMSKCASDIVSCVNQWNAFRHPESNTSYIYIFKIVYLLCYLKIDYNVRIGWFFFALWSIMDVSLYV